ncbi:peptidoglycan-binding domain-containing protein [Actinacidiphila acidipaludis]|uniref:Peptidoglycan-binding protein n=1 Tax=Actinacidiphila acidipaludis TaxID=2873382 RepID=A0ABS7Q6J9_9ACTN|nr:peptidoglycan-binding domain-containing protein [Streptomyces acidipaludis]MBY8878768.1 peptidoglycan-binding protein [Streptomyces acidipaludis]
MSDWQHDRGTPRRDVVRAPLGAGAEPPDVIEVVFPEAVPSVPPDPSATGAADRASSGSSRPRSRRRASPAASRSWPERPLLFGGLAIAVAGLTLLLAWVLWPDAPAGATGYPPLPGPASSGSSFATLPLPRTAPPARKGPPSASAGAPRHPTAGPRGSHGAPPPAVTTTSSPRTASGVPTASSASPTAGPRTLRSGDGGPDVRDLQQLLFQQGFTYVSVSGVYDEPTVRGVTQLQEDRGLTCDPPGVYGPCTRAALTA